MMRELLKGLVGLIFLVLASPGYGLEISINGQFSDIELDECELSIHVSDTWSAFGYRQETYTLIRSGSSIDSKIETFYGFGSYLVSHTFYAPGAAGTYWVQRSGLGTTTSKRIEVSLAPGLNCEPSFETANWGDRMWFDGRDWKSRPVIGDFDNDGFIDDIVYNGRCGTGTACWRAHIGNGSGFSVQNFGGNMWFAGNAPTNVPVAGDFDNDGYVDDIVYWGKCGSGTDCWRVHMSDGSSFSSVANFGNGMWFQGSTPANAPVVGDFDNDEFVDDIAYWGKCGSGTDCWRVHYSNGSSFLTAGAGADMWFEGSTPVHEPVVGDFDNDGFADDLTYWGKCGSGTDCWRLHRSTGTSFVAQGFGASMWFGGNQSIRSTMAADLDGDGWIDDMVYFGKCGSGHPNWRQHRSTGATFNAACSLGSPNAWFAGIDPIHTPMTGDLDHDGELDDIVYYGKCGSGTDCWRVHLWN